MTTRLEPEDRTSEAALVQVEHEVFMPALSIQQAVQRFNAVVEFVRTVMREGVDYGVIPGTDKHTLLKPGAEKLCTLFGLTSRFEIIRSVEDWTGEDHQGEPFFFYLYRCQLWRGDRVISEGDGSCNSWEQKYRYREAQRKCPACGQAAIIRGKDEYGGGWLCFRKRGGCGAKFDIEDAVITGQQAGRVMNENIADQVNTIQKMSQKRALIAATLLAVNGSEFFTQDNEEFMIDPDQSKNNGADLGAASRLKVAPGAGSEPRAVAGPGERSFVERVRQAQWRCTPAQKQMILNLLTQALSAGASEDELCRALAADYGVDSPASLAPGVVPRYINALKQMLLSTPVEL
ncbi:MAG TPA: hypothetical protein VNI02_12505 [Blastocatellia bacterium]|jgi:hypothetical protein|nr:hypothetical protein [Blastocatellia bacterium]